jgi:hypothetical protein
MCEIKRGKEEIFNQIETIEKLKNKEGIFVSAFLHELIEKGIAQTLERANFLYFLISQFGRLDRIKSYIEKNFDKPAEVYFDYLSWKHKLNKDDIITIFIVIVGLIEGKTINEAKKFWDELEKENR